MIARALLAAALLIGIPRPPQAAGEFLHWAFQPLRRVEPPAVRDASGCRTEIDRFILAALEAKGLAPAPPAGRQRFIRRASFGLTGLPPAPDEIEAFVSDPAPDAPGKLVDRLLASPRFGERWARHWLDVARYADSTGYERDADRPTAWHFRDFVIRAFNDDMPFDTFVKLQLAADELRPGDIAALAGLGFLACGPVMVSSAGTPAEKEQYRYDEMDDLLSTTGSAMLGLTIGCARCHDHKYDPIPARDYYRMIAAFAGTKRNEATSIKPGQQPPDLTEGKPLHLTDRGPEPEKAWLLRRGDPSLKIQEVTLGFLTVLGGGAPARVERPPDAKTSFQRAAMAEWLTDVEKGAGALLARVIVNRLWHHHFGQGLVRTPSDFGTQGDRPSHPELLEWLAGELVARRWGLKAIHRLILSSAAYAQDTTFDPAKAKVDPDNRLLWRRRPQRLEAEILRDAVLAASGQLDRKMYGPAVKPAMPAEAIATRSNDKKPPDFPKADGPELWRRSVYLFTKRSVLFPLMEMFDAPDASASCGRRSTSTVAPQALAILNDPFMRRQARHFAGRVEAEAPGDRVRRTYLLALGRPPAADEAAAAEAFLARRNLADLCHTLVTLNEFAYVD